MAVAAWRTSGRHTSISGHFGAKCIKSCLGASTATVHAHIVNGGDDVEF